MRREVAVPVVQSDAGLLTEPLHDPPGGVRRYRGRGQSVFATDEQVAGVLPERLDLPRRVTRRLEALAGGLRESGVVKRREHRPVVVRWVEHALQLLQRVDDRLRHGGLVVLLFLPEDREVAVAVVKVAPPHATAAVVVRVPQQFGTAHRRVRQSVHQGAVPAGPDGLVLRPRPVVIGVGEAVDRRARLLVDEPGDGVAVLGAPGLLVARTTPVVVGQRSPRRAGVGVVAVEIPLGRRPPAPCGDVGVVRADRAGSVSLAHQVSGVRTEQALAQVSEADRRLHAAVAPAPLQEPVEFAGGLPAVVARGPALALALVGEKGLDGLPHRAVGTTGVTHHPLLGGPA